MAAAKDAPAIRTPDEDALREAATRLRGGELVAFPTETVYGLGADATNERAVAKIFAAKQRPQFNPLIVHLADAGAAARLVEWTPAATRLAAAFWPGPLTLVLKRADACPVAALASAGLETLAVRVPAHPVARALLGECGLPLAAPSANRSGEVSPTRPEHVAESLGARVALILDGGPCAVGLESTVLSLAGEKPVLLRPGAVTGAQIAKITGEAPERAGAADPLASPGMLASHYAPGLPVRLDVTEPPPDAALLAFGPDVPAGAQTVMNLSEAGDLTEAAANLFAMLRALDRHDFREICVMPIPHEGLGLAINDRLARAAAPRD
jgi:L-threonylcarbamoyladenylate synthase